MHTPWWRWRSRQRGLGGVEEAAPAAAPCACGRPAAGWVAHGCGLAPQPAWLSGSVPAATRLPTSPLLTPPPQVDVNMSRNMFVGTLPETMLGLARSHSNVDLLGNLMSCCGRLQVRLDGHPLPRGHSTLLRQAGCTRQPHAVLPQGGGMGVDVRGWPGMDGWCGGAGGWMGGAGAHGPVMIFVAEVLRRGRGPMRALSAPRPLRLARLSALPHTSPPASLATPRWHARSPPAVACAGASKGGL